ncbi:MAG: hypothetical protein J6U98_09235 [Abditibacteriota bacterium]|nr:hypothetical protein [Abditibacteriota bacterium]
MAVKSKKTLYTAISVLALAGLIVSGAFTDTFWQSYCFDRFHTGQNNDANHIKNPETLDLVWVFPRDVSTKSSQVVDNVNGRATGSWTLKDREGAYISDEDAEAQEAEGIENPIGNFSYTAALPSDSTNPDKPFTWTFSVTADMLANTHFYKIQVWIPALTEEEQLDLGYTFSQNAVYTLRDDYGEKTYSFNQRDTGGWQELTYEALRITRPGSYRVTLSAITGDNFNPEADSGESPSIAVAADAVRLVPITGMEVYSSPASGSIPWSTTVTYGLGD